MILDPLSGKDMHHRAAGVLGLEPILQVEIFEYVVRMIDRKLGRIRIEGRTAAVLLSAVAVCGDDIGICPAVYSREPVAGAFRRRCPRL